MKVKTGKSAKRDASNLHGRGSFDYLIRLGSRQYLSIAIFLGIHLLPTRRGAISFSSSPYERFSGAKRQRYISNIIDLH